MRLLLYIFLLLPVFVRATAYCSLAQGLGHAAHECNIDTQSVDNSSYKLRHWQFCQLIIDVIRFLARAQEIHDARSWPLGLLLLRHAYCSAHMRCVMLCRVLDVLGWLHPSVSNFVRYGAKRRNLMATWICRASAKRAYVIEQFSVRATVASYPDGHRLFHPVNCCCHAAEVSVITRPCEI